MRCKPLALSMTGYGRGIKNNNEYSITIDLKSINHRYLELYFKIPKVYSFLEDGLRRDISNKISRGKFEILVNIERFSPLSTQVQLNKPLLSSYLTAIKDLKKEFKLKDKVTVSSIINLPDLFKSSQVDEDFEKLKSISSEALDEAITALLAMRKTEGIGLVKDLQSKINYLNDLHQKLQLLAPEVVISYQEKLTKRIQELVGNIEIDPNRLATEIALFADKTDINEELVRIESHLQQFLSALQLTEPIGRRLDFIIQELNREINTIGSKANDLRISQIVIEFKSELEKMREQIQNIE